MEYLSKVSLAQKVRGEYMIKLSVVGSISLIGIILAIISITTSSFLFAFWYIIAAILGISYVIIRINTIFPTYLATDGEKVVFSVWKNGLFPYTLPEKPNIFSDFIPDKIKRYEIEIENVGTVIIGSKKFILRNIEPENCPKVFRRFEGDKRFEASVRRMDFIYIKTKEGKSCFMPITNFDILELAKFLSIIEKNCHGVTVLANIPKLVRLRNK